MSLEEIRAQFDAAASGKSAKCAIVTRLWAQLYHFEELSAGEE